MISCELGIAIREGDSGTWYTDYVEIPDCDDIEVVAAEKFFEELAEKENPPDVVHVWLYHWEEVEDE